MFATHSSIRVQVCSRGGGYPAEQRARPSIGCEAVRVGLALPQYDYSVAGERPLRFGTVLQWARRAERLGFDSLWLSDHVVFDLAKYGGSDERYGLLEPLTTLAALAREVPRIRLGTLVLCDGLRP